MKRKILIGAAIVLGLGVVLVVALPLLVNVDSFRPLIEAQATSGLGRQVKIGHLQLSILAGGIKADDITIADDPAFSRSPFLQARSLEVGVDLPALIFSRTLNVRSFTVTEPSVVLLRSPSGKWNFSSLGAKSSGSRGSGSRGGAQPAAVSVQKLSIQKARLEVGAFGGKRQVYDNVSLEASNLSYGSAFPFIVRAQTPGGGSLQVQGKAGPINRTDASDTPFDAQVAVKDMDLASTGFIPPESGLAGVLDYTGSLRSDGKTLHAEGSGTTHNLRLVKTGSPARQPVGLDYASDYDLDRQTGTLARTRLKTGNSQVQMTGNYDAHGNDLVVHMKLLGQKLAMQDISGLLPALGVALPLGSSLQGGTVNANLAVDGTLDKLVTSGLLDVSNVKLTGFSLVSKLSTIATLAGLRGGPDTTIQTLSSRLRIAPEGMRADDLALLVPGLGTVTGAGTIAPNNALDFKLLAKLDSSASLVGGLAKMAGLGASTNTIPILVQGTTSNPTFLPDVSGMVKNPLASPAQGLQSGAQGQPGGVQGLGDVLNGIFGKKKKQ